MSITLNVQITIQEMELKRMQPFAQHHGFSHPETVLLSQELDDLFNIYHQLNKK